MLTLVKLFYLPSAIFYYFKFHKSIPQPFYLWWELLAFQLSAATFDPPACLISAEYDLASNKTLVLIYFKIAFSNPADPAKHENVYRNALLQLDNLYIHHKKTDTGGRS